MFQSGSRTATGTATVPPVPFITSNGMLMRMRMGGKNYLIVKSDTCSIRHWLMPLNFSTFVDRLRLWLIPFYSHSVLYIRMKQLFLALFLLLMLASGPTALAQAPLMTIVAARTTGPAYGTTGTAITVTGIVTNGAELGTIRYFQDATGGMAAYGANGNAFLSALNNIRLGDSIVVSGTLVDYKGLYEINPITALRVVTSSKPLPEPVAFPLNGLASAFAEQYEGRLVRLNGQTGLTNTTGGAVTTISGGATYRLSGVMTAAAFVNAASTAALGGLVGQTAPTGGFDLIGIMSQFASSSSVATAGGGYQVLPRLATDLVLPGSPNINSAPYPTGLITTGFTVNYSTLNPGTTRIHYGLSPTALTSTSDSVTALTTDHMVTVTGLLPATVYYVQVSSSNAIGTSHSLAVPMITVSQSSGRMWAYFNNPVNNTLASPGTNKAVYAPNGSIADTLASYIGRATQTLDIAIYNWNNTSILTAVNAAAARGVRVRLIYDGSTSSITPKSGLLNAAVATAVRNNPSGVYGIMHNKFVIIDASSATPNAPVVWTGSTNWTADQLTIDRNSAIVVQDQSLARVYTIEFEEMWGGAGSQPGIVLFGANKTDNTPHYLRIGGKAVESWFSPTDNVNGHLIQTVQTADNDLHIAAMTITQIGIAKAVRDQMQLRNITSCSEGITNDTTTSDGTGLTFRTFRQGMGARFLKKTSPSPNYIFHHKYLLVDAGNAASDPTLFVGSHNWSAAANTTNDENTLIVHDNAIVNQYYQEFYQRVNEQNQGVTPCVLTLLASRSATTQQSGLTVYPNPTHGSFRVVLPAATARTANVIMRDVTGRVVLTQYQSLNGIDLTIDATSLKPGLYMMQVTTPEAMQTSRVVVQ